MDAQNVILGQIVIARIENGFLVTCDPSNSRPARHYSCAYPSDVHAAVDAHLSRLVSTADSVAMQSTATSSRDTCEPPQEA